MRKIAVFIHIYLTFSQSGKLFALDGLEALYGKEMKPASLFLDTAPQVKIPIKLDLKSTRVELNVSRMFLGDIYECSALASICDEISGVDLGESPEPGKVDTIRGEDLQERVMDRIGDAYDIEFGASDVVSFRSKVQSFNQKIIQDSLESQLMALAKKNDFRIEIKTIRPKKSLKIRPGDMSVIFSNLPDKINDFFSIKTQRVKRRLIIAAEVLTDFNGFSENHQVDLVVTFELLANVYVANQVIPAGVIAKPSAFEQSWVAIDKMPMFDFKKVEGKKLTRRLRAGDYLAVGLYKEPDVINRGDEVDIIMVNQGMQLKRKGKALNHARLGEDVKIRLDDNRKLKGIAISKSTVRISL